MNIITADRKPYLITLLNSTMAFTGAFFITTLIHEIGHFLSYWIGGANPVLYHNYVSVADNNLNIHLRIISALAGPVISLIQGTFFLILLKIRIKNNVNYLLILWLSLLGFVNFFGYLLMTPFSSAGDTGKVAEMLELSMFYRVLIAGSGLIILIFIILKTGNLFSYFIPGKIDLRTRRNYVYSIMFFPIIIGSLVRSFFTFPIPALVSVIYTAASSYVIMISFGIILKNPVNQDTNNPVQKKISTTLIVILLVVIILNRLLTRGFG